MKRPDVGDETPYGVIVARKPYEGLHTQIKNLGKRKDQRSWVVLCRGSSGASHNVCIWDDSVWRYISFTSFDTFESARKNYNRTGIPSDFSGAAPEIGTTVAHQRIRGIKPFSTDDGDEHLYIVLLQGLFDDRGLKMKSSTRIFDASKQTYEDAVKFDTFAEALVNFDERGKYNNPSRGEPMQMPDMKGLVESTPRSFTLRIKNCDTGQTVSFDPETWDKPVKVGTLSSSDVRLSDGPRLAAAIEFDPETEKWTMHSLGREIHIFKNPGESNPESMRTRMELPRTCRMKFAKNGPMYLFNY